MHRAWPFFWVPSPEETRMVNVIINLDHAIATWIESLVLIVARNMQDMARDMTRQEWPTARRAVPWSAMAVRNMLKRKKEI
jgi:hypothetical protein